MVCYLTATAFLKNRNRTYLGWVNDALFHHVDVLAIHSVIANF